MEAGPTELLDEEFSRYKEELDALFTRTGELAKMIDAHVTPDRPCACMDAIARYLECQTEFKCILDGAQKEMMIVYEEGNPDVRGHVAKIVLGQHRVNVSMDAINTALSSLRNQLIDCSKNGS